MGMQAGRGGELQGERNPSMCGWCHLELADGVGLMMESRPWHGCVKALSRKMWVE
jgi:hypothetical protein